MAFFCNRINNFFLLSNVPGRLVLHERLYLVSAVSELHFCVVSEQSVEPVMYRSATFSKWFRWLECDLSVKSNVYFPLCTSLPWMMSFEIWLSIKTSWSLTVWVEHAAEVFWMGPLNFVISDRKVTIGAVYCDFFTLLFEPFPFDFLVFHILLP